MGTTTIRANRGQSREAKVAIEYNLKCKDPKLNIKIPEHQLAQFVKWFEEKTSSDSKAQYLRHYKYALTALGITPAEGESILKMFKQKDYRTLLIQAKYYPYVIPRQLAEIVLIKSITDDPALGNRKSILYRRLRIAGLFWNSSRIDYLNGRPTLKFPISYIRKYCKGRRESVIADIRLFEKWGLIHAERIFHETTQYRWAIDVTRIETFPLIVIEPKHEYWPCDSQGNIKLEMDESDVNDLLHRLSKDNETFYEPQRKALPLLYRCPEDTDKLYKTVEGYQKTAIESLFIDRDLLMNFLTDPSREKDYHIIQDCLENGIQSEFAYTRSRRRKSKRAANHLITSRKEGKRGRSLWDAIQVTLWGIDFHSADLLSIAVLSGDEKLINDLIHNDLYEMILNELRLFHLSRSEVKLIVLATLYSIGKKGKKKLIRTIGEHLTFDDFDKIKRYLDTKYTRVSDYKTKLIKMAGSRIKSAKNILLFNGQRIGLEKGKEYTIVPLMMQATVSYLTNRLFIILQDMGVKPVFDLHDEVICREKPSNMGIVNQKIIQIVNEISVRQGHNCFLDERSQIVDCDPIKTHPHLNKEDAA
jgi:hypothetical protein